VSPNFRDEFLVPLTLAVSDLAVLLLILSWRLYLVIGVSGVVDQ
jgi:hypothetical protein